jgi:hypothetical protein
LRVEEVKNLPLDGYWAMLNTMPLEGEWVPFYVIVFFLELRRIVGSEKLQRITKGVNVIFY